ncbi:MAG: domain containing protein [Hyphomicrobiales bacterium]|nr:domain containing protein [Hyphomicrobiales bacterium]
MSVLPPGEVLCVSASPAHTISKAPVLFARLVAGLGVEGDAHAGATVKHRHRVAKAPHEPNLRQVHLIHGELLDELNAQGFDIAPGAMGENLTTRGIDLLNLPRGARLRMGAEAVVEITGLREPCRLLDKVRPGLMAATLERREGGAVWRKAGVMGVVLASGEVRAGDPILVELPGHPHVALRPV